MTDFLWSLSTSNLALGIVGCVLAVALVIGFMPLLSYFPVIGPYGPVAKLVAFLLFGLLCALIDRRSADSREQIATLQKDLAFSQLQLNNSTAAAADKARLDEASKAAAAADDLKAKTYEQWLKTQPASPAGCDDLSDDDVRWLRDIQPRRAAGSIKAGHQPASRLRGFGEGPDHSTAGQGAKPQGVVDANAQGAG
ncbi:hypothetical protein [Bradyrhizobium sp. SZCCHNS1012]|uniref:hypothetical protein n=1 Tax=Bradyrhizobium sp. SZCCHNS1012 TaxID=3057297 RepID=UPI002916066E|nr:hypothetical protein [Bradyrhizobium sp. SZCCHNS1012]